MRPIEPENRKDLLPRRDNIEKNGESKKAAVDKTVKVWGDFTQKADGSLVLTITPRAGTIAQQSRRVYMAYKNRKLDVTFDKDGLYFQVGAGSPESPPPE